MKRAFTLLELLVVIAIMGLIASLTMISIRNARARSRDTARIANIDTLKKSLELYFNIKGEYPNSWGITNDCSGGASFSNSLNPLIAEKVLNEIPHDPAYPNNPHPACFYYIVNSACGTGDSAHPYVLLFTTETLDAKLPSFNNEPNRYCVYP